MKTFAVILLGLVATLILNGPIQSYATAQPDPLLQIATQARENLKMNISQINNVPAEITRLFKQGSDETDALANAINKKDSASARHHFLSAMNFFKTTNDKINSLGSTQANIQKTSDISDLQDKITRIKNQAQMLKTIAITNHANFDFTNFDQLIQKAKQDLDNGNISKVSKSIDAANQILVDAHHSLTEVAKQRSSDRAKDFTEKQIQRLDKIGNASPPNQMMQPPKVSPMAKTSSNFTSPKNPKVSPMAKTSSNFTSPENPKDMAKLRKLASEGKYDEALKIIKSFKEHPKQKSENDRG